MARPLLQPHGGSPSLGIERFSRASGKALWRQQLRRKQEKTGASFQEFIREASLSGSGNFPSGSRSAIFTFN